MLGKSAFGLVLAAAVLFVTPLACAAQGVTSADLQALAPSEQDLQGFVRIQPPGDTVPGVRALNVGGTLVGIQPQRVGDLFTFDHPTNFAAFRGLSQGTTSYMARELYSTDGVYHLGFLITVADSVQTAKNILALNLMESQFRQAGSLEGPEMLGDESYVWPTFDGGSLKFRYGRAIVEVSGNLSNEAIRSRPIPPPFPVAAIDGAAEMVLLRLAQHASLVSASSTSVKILVSGKTMASRGVMVGKQIFVPLVAFASSIGCRSQWDPKTGGLTVSKSPDKEIHLAAGSSHATSYAGKGVQLTTPVVKLAGLPMMTLRDVESVFGVHGGRGTDGFLHIRF